MNDLARRYMDLWHEHLDAVANDQDTAKVLAETMAMMSSGAQAFAAQAQDQAQAAATGGSHDRQPVGTAPAAAADGGAGADGAQFHERLAALEKRVAELESEVASGRSKVRRRTAKGRT